MTLKEFKDNPEITRETVFYESRDKPEITREKQHLKSSEMI
jgi:hypothetical protein